MADLKQVSCPSCNQKYRLPDSIENRKVVCRGCQFTFSVPGDGNGQSGPGEVEQSNGSFDGAMFDSLNVDDLLNAESSGLSQRSAAPTSDSNNDVATQEPPKSNRSAAPSKTSNDTTRKSASVDDDPHGDAKPAAQPVALPITLPETSRKKSGRNKKKKKKKKRKSPVAVADTEVAEQKSDDQSELHDERPQAPAVDAIDPEEQAVFDYARAVNGRKNAFAVVVAMAIAISLGGWFLVQEIARLKVPLTAKEREILEDQGFRLKARRAPREGQFVDLDDDVQRVAVAAGVRLDRLDLLEQQGAGEGEKAEFDPNALFDKDNPKWKNQRKEAKKARPIDFDTNIAAEKKASSFTLGDQKLFGPALAVSPRNIVFVPEQDGIASYDLVSKKRVDYKSFGRIVGRPDKVASLATTHDGRFMAAGFDSGRVKIFQIVSKGKFYEVIKLPREHFRPIRRIAVSPDSQSIATVDADLQLAVWNVTTGEKVWRHKVGNSQAGRSREQCLDLAFTEDGQQLIAALSASDVILQASSGHTVARKNRPPRKSAVVSPINRSSVSCTETEVSAFPLDGDAGLWMKSIRKSKAPAVALAAGGKTGLFFDGGAIIEFDLQTGELQGRLAPVAAVKHQADSRLVVSADGEYLVSANRNYANNRLRVNNLDGSNVDASSLPELPPMLELPARSIPELWGNKDGKPTRKLIRTSLPDSGGKISAVAIGDDGLLFYSTESGGLYVYDWTNGFIVEELSVGRDKAISSLARCGKWLAAGQRSGAIMFHEVQSSGKLRPHGNVFGHDAAVIGIESMPIKPNQEKKDRDTIASLSKKGNLRVWEIPTRGSLLNVDTFREAPKSLVVLDDRKILVASTIHLATVNPDTQKVSVEGSRQGGSRVAVSPDGKKLAFINRREITVAKARTGVVGKPVSLNQNPGAFQFTGDSKLLRIVFPDNVGIVNFRTGKAVDVVDAKIQAHSDLEIPFTISPNKTLMAAVTKEGQQIIIVPVEK